MARYKVPCSIELVPGRGPDPWASIRKWLRMQHHIASYYVPTGSKTPLLGLVKNGREDLPGPLANGYGGFDLVYRILCMGMANHSGLGGPVTIDGVTVPKDSGRGPTWGTEYEGGYQEWANIPGMLEFMGRCDNALADWSGRPITSQLEHSTWTTRKSDRRGFTRTSGIALTSKWRQPVVPPAPVIQAAGEGSMFILVKGSDPARKQWYWHDAGQLTPVVGWSELDADVYTLAATQNAINARRAKIGLPKIEIFQFNGTAGGHAQPFVWQQHMLDRMPGVVRP